MKTTVKMTLKETIKLLQETNPVRLQPSSETVTAHAQTQPAATHLSKKDNFANGKTV